MVREDTWDLGIFCVEEKELLTRAAWATLPCVVPATARGQTWEWGEVIIILLWRKEGIVSLAKNLSRDLR